MPGQQAIAQIPSCFRAAMGTARLIAIVLISAACIVISSSGSAQQPAQPANPADFAPWGRATLAAIDRDLWIDDLRLFAEEAGQQNRGRRRGSRRESRKQPAFLWSAGVQLSALAAAARVDPELYVRPLADYAEALQSYWQADAGGIGGYDVQPTPKEPDRYYDDNAWMALALLETFEVTAKPEFADRAAAALRFVLSGEDDLLGGGIYWRENARDSKNTCSNGPAIVAALRLYQHHKQAADLETAFRIYNWTNSKLQDEDGLYWDNIRRDGSIDERKYSYNSALMIRANCLLHEVTREEKYLAEAQRIARAAEAHWVDSPTGQIRDAGKFAHMLLEAFLSVGQRDGNPHWSTVVRRTLNYLHEDARDTNGRYPSRWDRPVREPLRGYELIDQASVARAYWVANAAFADK